MFAQIVRLDINVYRSEQSGFTMTVILLYYPPIGTASLMPDGYGGKARGAVTAMEKCCELEYNYE